jgi:hypothetical protein
MTRVRFAPSPSEPAAASDTARLTLERFRELELARGALDGRDVVRELKAIGDLRALRLALAGRDGGAALAAIIDSLPRDEALRRIDAAL